MSNSSVPTEDTPLSYQARCGACEELIGKGDTYCKHCGVRIDWDESEQEDRP